MRKTFVKLLKSKYLCQAAGMICTILSFANYTMSKNIYFFVLLLIKIIISNGNRTEWSTIQGVIGESFQIGRARSARLI